jgi:hypothetical protein
MKNLSTPVKRGAQALIIPLLLFSSALSSPVLALDDYAECTYDFFTGHCTYGGPYDEPGPEPEIDYPEPYEPAPPYSPAPQPTYPSSPQPTYPSPEPAPVCERKPYLPQCE